MLRKTALLSLFLSLFSFDALAGEDLNLPPADEIREVCEYVASLKHIGGVTISGGFLDINNDGKVEKINLTRAGTAHVPMIQYEDLEGNRVTVQQKNFEWKGFWNYGAFWLPYKSYNYFVGTSEDRGKFPSHVSYITEKNEEYWLCSFRSNVDIRLMARSQRDLSQEQRMSEYKLCNLVKDQKVKYLNLSPSKHDEKTYYGPFHSKVRGEVEVDYNNDGQIEKLIHVDQASGAGRGCDASFFSEYRNGGVYEEPHPITVLHDLQETEPNDPYPISCRGNTAKWFEYEGRNYLELKGADPLYWVGVIEDGKPRRICDSRFTWTYEVDKYSDVVK